MSIRLHISLVSLFVWVIQVLFEFIFCHILWYRVHVKEAVPFHPVVIEGRIRSGQWLALLLCVLFSWATRFCFNFFLIFCISVPCARLSWPFCQLLTAR